MRPVPFLLRKCDLFQCNRPGEHLLDDGRAVCKFHAMLIVGGQVVTERRRREEDAKRPDFTLGEEEGS